MKNNTVSNTKLGLFVIIGTVMLVGALYLIGNNQNMFHSTFKIHAVFYDVNGLMPGNNVRASGINVGTVKEIRILNDTAVTVTMIIDEDVRMFIKQNAIAMLGTDGIMGNKLINLNSVNARSSPIADGGTLTTSRPVETDQMLRTLDKTNNNLSLITSDLKEITDKINNSKALWTLLSDSTMTEDINQSFRSIRTTTHNSAEFTKGLNDVMGDIKKGKGTIGYLLTDTIAAMKLRMSIDHINEVTVKANLIANDLKLSSEKMHGNGAVGVLIHDTVFSKDLRVSIRNIRESSEKLNQNMEAMKHNFLFRGYFRKQEKKINKMKTDSISLQSVNK